MTREEALVELLAVRQGLSKAYEQRPDVPLETIRPFLTRAGHAVEALGEPLAAQHCLAHGTGRAGSLAAETAFWKLDFVTLFAEAVAASERAVRERQASTQQ